MMKKNVQRTKREENQAAVHAQLESVYRIRGVVELAHIALDPTRTASSEYQDVANALALAVEELERLATAIDAHAAARS